VALLAALPVAATGAIAVATGAARPVVRSATVIDRLIDSTSALRFGHPEIHHSAA